MKMTKEQKAERKRERLAIQNETSRRFPRGRVDNISEDAGLIVELEVGHGPLTVRQRNGNGAPWNDVGRIWLEYDLRDLARFIHALTCRYNERVAVLNEITCKTAVEKLDPIKSENES